MEHSIGVRRGGALLPLAAILLAAAAGCKQQTQHAPDVWAIVNGKEIKRAEVDKYYRTRVNAEGQEPSQEESLSLKLIQAQPRTTHLGSFRNFIPFFLPPTLTPSKPSQTRRGTV